MYIVVNSTLLQMLDKHCHGSHEISVIHIDKKLNILPTPCKCICIIIVDLPYTTIVIFGTGFNNSISYNIVSIGGMVCIVTTATSTTIHCDIDNGPGGEHTVIVEVLGKGTATHRGGEVTIAFNSSIDNFTPSSSGLGGMDKIIYLL